MSSRAAYLKKYVSSSSNSGGDYATGDSDYAAAPVKKKKIGTAKSLVKKNAITGEAGLRIIDEDIDWQATRPQAAKEPEEEKAVIVDMRGPAVKKEPEPTRYIKVERADGSGWATVDHPAKPAAASSAASSASRPRVDADGDHDMEPRRRRRHDSPEHDDDVPTRRPRHDSPEPAAAAAPRRARHDSPDNSPPRKRRHDSPDHNPPRRQRHDSPDNSPPRRPRHDSPDQAPARRPRHDSPDNSPPRRARHDSPDNSPPRRPRHDSPDTDEPQRKKTRFDSGPSSNAAAAVSSSTAAASAAPQKQGLILAADFKARNASAAEKARADLEKIASLSSSSSSSGQAPHTIIRDQSGRRMTQEEYEEEQRRQKETKQSKPMEWAGGLAQQNASAARAQELARAAATPFARTADDAGLNAAQMEVDRWGDPMLLALRKREKESAAEQLRATQAAQEKLLRKEQRRAKKEIKKEKKAIKHDRKKLLRQLEKQRIIDSATNPDQPPASQEDQERIVDQMMAERYNALSQKKAALRVSTDEAETRIALDLASGGNGIILPTSTLATVAPGVKLAEARPMYTKGQPWPNRYNIKPGYRWDGVERGTGWEDKRIRWELERQNKQNRAYKFGSADM